MAKHLLIPDVNLLLLDVDVLDDLQPSPAAQEAIDRAWRHEQPTLAHTQSVPQPPPESLLPSVAAAVFKATRGSVAFKTQAVAKALECSRYAAQEHIAEANRRGLIGR